MKIACIWSSPNTDGLTASAKNCFLAGARSAGAQIEEIHLNSKDIRHCMACGNGWGTCRSNGACLIGDDFDSIYQTLAEADGIVFITAVYWHDMTEQMKAFMDRLRRCEASHNHYLENKRCFLIACAGGTGRGTSYCLLNMEEALTHMGMRPYDRIPVIRFNRDYILPALEQAGAVYAQRLPDKFDMMF